MAYLPIEDYGLIGNMHTAALVGRNGSIDWLCMPNFDSPSVFCKILDDTKGGYFKVAPTADKTTVKQVYWPQTQRADHALHAWRRRRRDHRLHARGHREGRAGYHQLIRRVHAIRGEVPVRVECYPAFNYARDEHKVEHHRLIGGALFQSQSS